VEIRRAASRRRYAARGLGKIGEAISSANRPRNAYPPPLPLAVFRLGDGKLAFGRYANLVREKGTISMTLSVEDDEDAAKFKTFPSHGRTLAIGWSVDAAMDVNGRRAGVVAVDRPRAAEGLRLD
jgi:hypothetical protein